MYKIGLKLWSTNVDYYLREAARLYVDKVFDYIELFVVPETISTLESWRRLRQELGISFIIHNAHSVVGFNLAERECEQRNLEIYRQTRLFADELDARHMIFHGGVDGSVDELVRQLKQLEEPRSLLENKPYLPLPGPQNCKVCRGATLDEISYVISEVGCGFCLDIGHAVCAANSQGLEPYSYIEKLASLGPAMFHLSDVKDMTSQYDVHPHLGTGQLDLRRLKKTIFPEDAVISVETVKDSKCRLDDFSEDVLRLRNA